MDQLSAVEQHTKRFNTFTEVINHLRALYNDEKLDECEDSARAFLLDPALPQYHRVQTLILLTSVVDDLDEAEQFLLEAKSLFEAISAAHRPGFNAKVDQAVLDTYRDLGEAEFTLKRDLKAQEEGEEPGCEGCRRLQEENRLRRSTEARQPGDSGHT